MPFNAPEVQLAAVGPETILTLTALLLLVLDAAVGERIPGAWHLPLLSTAGLLVAAAFAVASWIGIADPDVTLFGLEGEGPRTQLAGMVALDGFSLFAKLTLSVFGLLTLWLGREYLRREGLEESEFYALILFAIAGMMLMTAAADLILMFIALETFSLALYVLVGLRRGSLVSQESSMKYFLLGAFSSAFFLFGIALAYGAVGSTNLYVVLDEGAGSGLVEHLATVSSGSLGFLVLATGLLIVGLAFKVAAVPFHMWTPDAYQGAPSPITGFMAAGTKLAAFAALLRLLDVSLFQLRADWRPLVIALAVVTMIVGSLFAVVQEDVKRLLAYSSIAHAGFVLTAVVAANDRGISGALFYLATYGLTVVGAFAVTGVLAGKGEGRTRLVDYKGLFYERPLIAGALTLFLLSLAGVPLTSGFVAKLVVFGPAIDAGFTWVVVVGVVASAIAAFFYLRIMVVMYMQEADEPVALEVGPAAGAVVGITALATIVFGLVWGPLFKAAEHATVFFTSG